MAAPLLMVEPVGHSGDAGRRGSKSGSKTSLEKTRTGTAERLSSEPDDPEIDDQWMPDHDPRDERGEFATRAQFLITVIGFTLGNGNFWHFPLAVRKFGGASFLLMYLITMAVYGVPMLYFEMMIGQIAQVGPMRAFQLNFPLLQGVGWSVCSLSFLRAVNFALLNAFSLEYASLVGVGTRTKCVSEWNSPACFSQETNAKFCKNSTLSVWFNSTCITLEERMRILPQIELPAREFFRATLRGLPGVDESRRDHLEAEFVFTSGRVVTCFCIVWCFACCTLLRRMEWRGRFSLYVVCFFGVLNLVFLIKFMCMDRSVVALQRFFHFDLEQFGKEEAWQEAIRWTRSSLCLGMGGMISMSSYNKRSNDAFGDAIIVCAVAYLVSVVSGIFTILAYTRHKFPFLNWKQQEKIGTGYTMYYIYYPEMLGEFEMDEIWSFLFYAMLLGLCISTFFGLLETPISALTDQFKFCSKNRSLTIIILCFVGFGLGLVQCTRVGFHIFYILDLRVLPLMAEVLVGLQLLTISLYGPRKFYRDVTAAMGKKVNFFGYFLSPYGLIVRISQFVICPCLIVFGSYDVQLKIFKGVFKRFDELLATVRWLPYSLAVISFLPWPIVIVGAIAAIVKNLKAGKAWSNLVQPDRKHPAVRYHVPPPFGSFFGVKPIEAMPLATATAGDDKAISIEFSDKLANDEVKA